MAQYTVTAFQWTGTYYNAQYNTSYSATFEDDDANYEGGTDANESVSINGGAFNNTSSAPYNINVSFTDTSGNPHVEPFFFFYTGGNWYFVPGPGSAFTVGATLGTYQSHTNGWQYADVTCFAAGTSILAKSGQVAVEDLQPGMKVAVSGGGYQPLRLNLSRHVGARELATTPKLRPVRISAGALGLGLPNRDLLVSRQHRMNVHSPIAQRMFGTSDVLIAAIKLCALPGIFIDETVPQITYHHLVFDAHQVIFAESAPTESLLLGPMALNALTAPARSELLTLFPDLAQESPEAEPAMFIPPNKLQKRLVSRHARNGQILVQAAPSAA